MSGSDSLPLKSIFQGRFILTRLLGKGGFGEVYAGVQTSDNEPVAIKLEKNTGRNSFLFHEARVMQEIQKVRSQDGIAGIATLRYFGQEGDYRMLIMTMHGSSLEDMHEKYGRFSLKTTVMLADQMLSRLEYVHSAGYVHRDLKTDNFLISRNASSKRIYLIDFGLSSKYIGSDGTHREMQTGKCFLGTSRFASLRTHKGYSQSRRDDLEQLVYIMIYSYRGRLPWSGLRIANHEEKEKRIGEIKESLSPAEICNRCPAQFEDLLYYARNMEFDEKPQYEMCRALVRSVLSDMDPPEELDYIFDWDPACARKKAAAPPVADISGGYVEKAKAPVKKPAQPAGAPNPLSDAKAEGIFSGFGSSNPPEKIFSIGEQS